MTRWMVVVVVVLGMTGLAEAKKPKPKPPVPPPHMCEARAPGHPNPQGGTCKADAECKAGKAGRCNPVNTSHGRMPSSNQCTYNQCAGDADCKTGGPCQCDDNGGNHCLAGNCQTDADCKTGTCERSDSMSCWGGEPSYFCRTPKDTCKSDDQCSFKGSGRGFSRCVYLPEKKHWGCATVSSCPVG